MASVDSRTRVSIDELINSTIISGSVNSSGHLIFLTRGGAEVDGGFIGSQNFGRWSPSASYLPGDMVGYSGQVWRSLAMHTNKPPMLSTDYWQRVHGTDVDDWPQTDTTFDGKNILTSGDWNFATYSGAAATIDLSSYALEIEGSRQSLRIQAPAGSQQSFYQTEEALVRGGDSIVVQVRMKIAGVGTGSTVYAQLLQNDTSGEPAPGAPGLVTTSPTQAAQTVTTSWATYTFNFTAAGSKPRGRIVIKTTAPSGGPITFLTSFVRVRKVATPLWVPEGYVGSLTSDNAHLTYALADEIHLPGGSQVMPDSSGKMGPLTWDAAGKLTTNPTGRLMWVGSVSGASIPATTFTVVANWTVTNATPNFCNLPGTGTSPTGTITVSSAGLYDINATVNWSPNSSGRRMVLIYVNGSEVRRNDIVNNGASTMMQQVTHTQSLAVGDEVAIRVYQNSGGALALSGSPGHDFQIARRF